MLKSIRSSKLFGILATLFVLVGIFPTAAHASGFLVSSSPSQGQSFHVAPHRVILEFSVGSIPTSLSGNIIRVTNSSGVPVEVGAATTAGSTLTVGLADGLTPGAYQVAYRYVCDDGHVLVSAFSFTVLTPPMSSPSSSSSATKPITPPESKPTPNSKVPTAASSASPVADEGPSPGVTSSAEYSAQPNPNSTEATAQERGEPGGDNNSSANSANGLGQISAPLAGVLAVLVSGLATYLVLRRKRRN